MDQQQKQTQQEKQTILQPAKIIAVGIAAPLSSLLTSRFGISGTLLGLAISSVILTTLVDALQAYLARASTKVVKVPSGLRTTGFSRQGIRGRLWASLSKVLSFPTLSLSPKGRRSILVGSLMAAVISFLVGLILVTGVEASTGKNLSCWVWNECPTTEESSDDSDRGTSTSTLPSILGGGPSTSSTAPQSLPVDSQQPPTPLPGSPKSSSGSPSEAVGTESPVPGAPNLGREEQSSPREEDQQSPPAYSDEDQQQSPPNTPEKPSPGEDQNSSSPNSAQKTRTYEVLQVPWTT